MFPPTPAEHQRHTNAKKEDTKRLAQLLSKYYLCCMGEMVEWLNELYADKTKPSAWTSEWTTHFLWIEHIGSKRKPSRVLELQCAISLVLLNIWIETC